MLTPGSPWPTEDEDEEEENLFARSTSDGARGPEGVIMSCDQSCRNLAWQVGAER